MAIIPCSNKHIYRQCRRCSDDRQKALIARQQQWTVVAFILRSQPVALPSQPADKSTPNTGAYRTRSLYTRSC
ncbi:MAG: hypothetical protein IPL33_12930 [Sphingobacteriales bacterium]|nr:hypothetical protein [Sphingobacteriales bacterium]